MSNIIMWTRKKFFSDSDKCIFLIVSIIFAIVLTNISIVGDDASSMAFEGGLKENWNQSVKMYSYWSSRVLVNFCIILFINHDIMLWAFFMGVCMYILCCALSKLFVEGNGRVCNLFIACIVMLLPYAEMCTVGWISTMTTYFSPVSFGLMSLVPIKMVAKGERFKIGEMVFYAICLLYGSNHEQMMVLILGCYMVSFVYFVVKKNYSIYHLVMCLLSVASCLFITCPGNKNRSYLEHAERFPAYGMLNMLDKAELGYTTSLRWLLFSKGNVLLSITCIILAFLIWRKYKDMVIRGIALFPAVITILFGPLSNITGQIFPNIELTKEIPYWGITNPENRGGLGVFVQFAVISMVIFIMCIELFLIADSFKELLTYITLFLCGIASRVAMGFSPTIYVSGYRTCAVMIICVIAICVGIYSKHLKNESDCRGEVMRVIPLMRIVLVLAMLNFCYIVCS